MARSVAFVVVLLSSCFLNAQVEARSNCDLLVRVRTSDERSIDQPVKVEVVLSSQGVIATGQIIGGDSAQFRVTNGKTYRLAVSGTDIETITTPYFEINSLEGTHMETVHVKFQNRKPAEESTPGAPIISVSEMSIPKKASGEMNKGMEAYSKGEMENAASHFERALKEYPRYARAYDMLGVVAIKGSNSQRRSSCSRNQFRPTALFCQRTSIWRALMFRTRTTRNRRSY
ncbi:MAG TPA: tetratricopeptide repeat protein [Terriglobales bacterium]|nr:tetratricopeptide repeat protein [Terriglobales bacterium]